MRDLEFFLQGLESSVMPADGPIGAFWRRCWWSDIRVFANRTYQLELNIQEEIWRRKWNPS